MFRSAYFLHHPAISVGVAERKESVVVAVSGVGSRRLLPILKVEEVAHIDPSFDELSVCGVDVGHNEVETLDRTSCLRVLHNGDRARRPRRRNLNHAKLIASPVVNEEVETRFVHVEGLGPIDI
jgi:hypothetical protein